MKKAAQDHLARLVEVEKQNEQRREIERKAAVETSLLQQQTEELNKITAQRRLVLNGDQKSSTTR